MSEVAFEQCAWKQVIVESPYGDNDPIEVMRNEIYCRAAIRDCLLRGEAPFASHGLYPLPGILRDCDVDDRMRGMRAGFAIGELFPTRLFFTDRGLSSGMWDGVIQAKQLNQVCAFRRLPKWEGPLFFDLEEAVNRFVIHVTSDSVPDWKEIVKHYPEVLKAAKK